MNATHTLAPRDLVRFGLFDRLVDAAKWTYGKLAKGRLGGKLKPKAKPPA